MLPGRTTPVQRAADCTRGLFFGLPQVALWRRPSKGGPIMGIHKGYADYNLGFTSQKWHEQPRLPKR